MECRQPETINPVSSKFFMVLEEAFAAFQRLVPHIPDVCILHIQKIYLWILGLKQITEYVFVSIICMYQVYVVELLLWCLYCILMH